MLIETNPAKETDEANNISETRQVPSVLLQNHTLPAVLASAGPRNHAPSTHKEEDAFDMVLKNCSWADRS